MMNSLNNILKLLRASRRAAKFKKDSLLHMQITLVGGGTIGASGLIGGGIPHQEETGTPSLLSPSGTERDSGRAPQICQKLSCVLIVILSH